MEVTFCNIDENYRKLRKEAIGDIQPKFWYLERTGHGVVLVKRQASKKNAVKNKPRSKMYNHYGEYFGFLIAEKAGLMACPVDLVFMYDVKNQYVDKKSFFTGCASHSLKDSSSILLAGESVVERFRLTNEERYNDILKKDSEIDLSRDTRLILSYSEDENFDVSFAAVISEVCDFESSKGIEPKQIREDMQRATQYLVDMTIYDCIFGNSDRHSRNWSMELNSNSGEARVYPAYDNEAVLGLRMSEQEISLALQENGKVDEFTDRILFSRMGFGQVHSGVSYYNMLQHLVDKYPNLAIPSMKKIVENVDEAFISSLYDAAEGISSRGEAQNELTQQDELPKQYREFGMNLVSRRLEFARKLVKLKSKDFDESENFESVVIKDDFRDKFFDDIDEMI